MFANFTCDVFKGQCRRFPILYLTQTSYYLPFCVKKRLEDEISVIIYVESSGEKVIFAKRKYIKVLKYY